MLPLYPLWLTGDKTLPPSFVAWMWLSLPPSFLFLAFRALPPDSIRERRKKNGEVKACVKCLTVCVLSLCLTASLSWAFALCFSQDASPVFFTSHFNFTHVPPRRPSEKVLFRVIHLVESEPGLCLVCRPFIHLHSRGIDHKFYLSHSCVKF